jgi:cytochrome c
LIPFQVHFFPERLMFRFIRQWGFLSCLWLFACAQADKDVSGGEQLYAQCMGCHSPGWHRTGPRHCDLIGRRAGSAEGFEFTQAMQDSGIIWTQATLDDFLKAPLDIVPGTSMGFAGITSARERQQLINYLSQLNKDNPVCR